MLASLAAEFDLHELAVEDAIIAHQRPKLERYGDTLFVVLRAARYVDENEEVEFGEMHIFGGPDFVLTVRHSEAPDLALVRHRMETSPDLLGRGPEAVLYAILDGVVDGYDPVVAGLAERHRRDRDPGVRRRPEGVAAHLRAEPRGHRIPAGRPGRSSRCFGTHRGVRQVRHR